MTVVCCTLASMVCHCGGAPTSSAATSGGSSSSTTREPESPWTHRQRHHGRRARLRHAMDEAESRRLRVTAALRPQSQSAGTGATTRTPPPPPVVDALRATPASGRRYEHLCDALTTTHYLNSRREEFDPPFVKETKCAHLVDGHSRLLPWADYLQPQKCGMGLFDCVQTYATVQVRRRRRGRNTHWTPYAKESVPSGCECMWPTDEYGPLHRHHGEL